MKAPEDDTLRSGDVARDEKRQLPAAKLAVRRVIADHNERLLKPFQALVQDGICLLRMQADCPLEIRSGRGEGPVRISFQNLIGMSEKDVEELTVVHLEAGVHNVDGFAQLRKTRLIR